MAKQLNHLYEFGSVRLDATNRLLYRDGVQLHVQPRVIETLLVLVENAHSVVDKDRLLDVVWKDVTVEEGALKRNIYLLRTALGDEARFIETLSKRGYRLTADVKERWEEIPVQRAEIATPELVIERRANLRISHEEEIIYPSRASRGHADSALQRFRLPVIAASMLGLAAVLGLLLAKRGPEESAAAPIRSLAVLPFVSLSAPGDDARIGVGLADALITRLSSIKDVKVRPTTAVLKFDHKEQDAFAAGQSLGVDAVLEGSIYRVGDRIRFTARLLRLSDRSTVWAGQFDEKADDYLRVQNSIAQQLVGSLSTNVSRSEKDALTKRFTESLDAYQLYVTGRYHWNKRSGTGAAEAENCFRKAIEIDPNFAFAYSGLADALTIRGLRDESIHAIEKAIELDDRLGEAHASRGFWKMFRAWRWDEAEADFRRAIELRPGYGTAHQWYATLLAITGRTEEAKAEMGRALGIDPTSHNFLADMGQMHYFAREYDEAESYCRKALEIHPNFGFARIYLTDIYLQKGDTEQAFEEEMKEFRIALSSSSAYLNREDAIAKPEENEREIHRRSGYRGFWRERIRILQGRRTDNFSYYGLFKYYSLLGEKEKALESLEKSYENRDFMLPLVNINPQFDSLRGEPRFRAVMQKMGLVSGAAAAHRASG